MIDSCVVVYLTASSFVIMNLLIFFFFFSEPYSVSHWRAPPLTSFAGNQLLEIGVVCKVQLTIHTGQSSCFHFVSLLH